MLNNNKNITGQKNHPTIIRLIPKPKRKSKQKTMRPITSSGKKPNKMVKTFSEKIDFKKETTSCIKTPIK